MLNDFRKQFNRCRGLIKSLPRRSRESQDQCISEKKGSCRSSGPAEGEKKRDLESRNGNFNVTWQVSGRTGFRIQVF